MNDDEMVAQIKSVFASGDVVAYGKAQYEMSAEDIVLAKLEWFRRGGEVSERQWGDVLGVLRASRSSLDRRYMDDGARELGVPDLLARAVAESERE